MNRNDERQEDAEHDPIHRYAPVGERRTRTLRWTTRAPWMSATTPERCDSCAVRKSALPHAARKSGSSASSAGSGRRTKRDDVRARARRTSVGGRGVRRSERADVGRELEKRPGRSPVVWVGRYEEKSFKPNQDQSSRGYSLVGPVISPSVSFNCQRIAPSDAHFGDGHPAGQGPGTGSSKHRCHTMIEAHRHPSSARN